MRRFRPLASRLLVLAAVCLFIPGCGRSQHAARSTHDSAPVLILAAASTQDALDEIAEALRSQGGPRLTVSPAGSNALAQQIIAGAPADLFLSANPTWADEVAQHGHAGETVPLLSGQLVLIVPSGNPANVQRPDELLGERVRRLALAGEHVPAGMYAEQALRKWNVYEPLLESGRIVRGENVRFAMAYVERGEVEAGIVYASDAAAASSVQIVFAFDAEDHEPIVYPLVRLKHGQERAAVREVFEFLQSPQAGAIFERHGFRPLAGAAKEAR